VAKIITRIFGDLGNQLFCYAAARRLEHKLELDKVIIKQWRKVLNVLEDHAQ